MRGENRLELLMNSFGLGTRNRRMEHEIKELARANGQFADSPRQRHRSARGGGRDYTTLRVARWIRRRFARNAASG